MNPKVSIIVPVYNAEKSLELCVSSARQQTLKNIEIICVDDCSQDESRRMLSEMAAEDDRIRLCFHEENKSVFVARKTGAAASTGEYVLFLDSDDYLDLTACEELYNKAEKEKVDILHFCSDVFNDGAVNEEQNKQIRKLLRPYYGRLTGADVFETGFARRKVWGTLWNKLYRGDLCRKAFSELPEAYYAVGEDLLTFCAIAYYAQSYLGWHSKPLYHYSAFKDISVDRYIDLEKFENRCFMADVNKAMVSFCKAKGVYDIADKYIEQLRLICLNACCESWYREIPKQLAVEGWKILCKHWGADDVITQLAEHCFESRKEIAQKLEDFPPFRLNSVQIRTVGIYYHRLYAGGIERVISILAPMFAEMGYRVVIITDEPQSANDFYVPSNIAREVVYNNIDTDWNSIGIRFSTWAEISEKHKLDIVIYNAWMSNLMFWDMLYLKNKGVPVVIHAHGVFSCTLSNLGELFIELPSEMHLADGIVTLSMVDKCFWDMYSQNVYFIPNPAAEELRFSHSGTWHNQSLIWVGRASAEKQPEKVFDIMELVVKQIPNAKLIVLGNFDDPKWDKIIEAKKLDNNVELCGMVPNVGAYLEKASVFVCTSQFEGFPMSLVEAQAHRLPTVMFRLPHVVMATSERGVISVDMDDVSSAAGEIVRFLQDEEYWKTNSEKAFKSYEWLRDYDMQGAWRNLLSGAIPESSRDKTTFQMINTLISQYELGCRNRDDVNKVTWFIQKIGGGVQCCAENGMRYSIRLAMRKIRKRFDKKTENEKCKPFFDFWI